MTARLWNKYDFSRKSPEVPVKRAPNVERKERAFIIIIFLTLGSKDPEG